jgi:hypothetical protein
MSAAAGHEALPNIEAETAQPRGAEHPDVAQDPKKTGTGHKHPTRGPNAKRAVRGLPASAQIVNLASRPLPPVAPSGRSDTAPEIRSREEQEFDRTDPSLKAKLASRSAWVSAADLRVLLLSAGIEAQQLTNAVAWYCSWHGLIATGFGRVHDGDQLVQGTERRHVPSRVWRVFRAPEKPELERFVGWDGGEFTWAITREDGADLQETWISVHFDRVAVETVVSKIEAQADVGAAYDWEVEVWIRTDCRTENSKEAWAAYREAFGRRAGKKSLFEARWRQVKRREGRGRLRKTDPPP